MIQVKICGITNLQDALCAAQNDVTAVGFIFYPPSPRYIDPKKAIEIIDQLPGHLVKVGVFVNEKEAIVRRIFEDCCLDMLQFHGDESHEYCGMFPTRQVIKGLELKKDEDVIRANDLDVAAILVDSRNVGLYGGTGKKANWELARKISKPLILSGGLNSDNVEDGLQKVRPSALDVNSGVEVSPGKKSPEKISQLMNIIKKTDLCEDKIIFIKR